MSHSLSVGSDGSLAAYSWEDTDYGAFHAASSHKRSQSLLVFVHGIFGGCYSTWGELPRFVLENASLDLDVLSFEYPSKWWQEASIESGARDLRTAMNYYAAYENLVFVTHSNGGLVTKKMLVDDLTATLAQIRDPGVDTAAIDSVSMRTRKVINIAVPHNGGNEALRKLGDLFYSWLLYPIFRPVAALFKGYGWGHNAIIEQLSWASPMLVRLEKEYVKLLEECDECGLARPVAIDILATNDVAVPRYKNVDVQSGGLALRSDEHDLVLRGSHLKVKIPKKPDTPIVSIIARELAFLREAEDLAVAVQSYRRALIVEHDSAAVGAAKTRQLALLGAEDAGAEGEDLRTVSFTVPFTQKLAYSYLRSFISSGSERPRRFVVTGGAGVGKSFVLRRLTKDVSMEFLAGAQARRPLVVFFPLYLFRVTPPKRRLEQRQLCAYIWERLVTRWCEWVNRLTEDTAKGRGPGTETVSLNPGWLEKRLEGVPAVLIFDGVDEFLLNQAYLGISDIGTLLDWLVERFSSNRRLTIIVGVRSSTPNLDHLVAGRGDILEIVRLTPGEADRRFPGARDLIDALDDEEARKLVLTPLVLIQLGTRLQLLTQKRLRSREDVLLTVLETLTERIGEDELGVHADDWINGLMFIAWRFFRHFRAHASIEQLLNDCAQDCTSWEKHLAYGLQSALAQSVLRGAEVASDRRMLDILLRRTVFVPTGEGAWRFTHHEWEEFLVAKYLEAVIRHQHFDELQHRAFTHAIYKSAGVLLQDCELTKEHVQSVLNTADRLQDQFVVGNFGALTGDTNIPIAKEAALHFLQSMKRFPSAARLTTLLDWGYRAVRGDSADTSLRGVRGAFSQVLGEGGFEAAEGTGNQLIASACWCYQMTLSVLAGTAQPPNPWPGLGSEDDALLIVAHATSGGLELTPKEISLQVGFLRIQLSELQDRRTVIATLHFLFPIAAAFARNASPRLVDVELPEIIADQSNIAMALIEFSFVPEVREVLSKIWQRCRQLIVH